MAKLRSFISYFVKYIFHSKTRQRLIYLAIVGLFLSSLSLLVLQGIMQGLQGNLIKRNKIAQGSYKIDVQYLEETKLKELEAELRNQNLSYSREYEIELLAKYDAYIAPVILRGVDFNFYVPSFLKQSEQSGVILGADLSNRLKSPVLSELTFFSPSHTDEMFGDVPLMSVETVSDIALTEVIEVDQVTAWVDITFVQNLIREESVNTLRFFKETPLEEVEKVMESLGLEPESILTWEEQNPSLLWAFKLETMVMISLFVCMCFLVSLTIVSGNLIFFNRIRLDLISFWILGLSKKTITWLMIIYFQLKTVITCILGLVAGGGILWWLKNYAPEIMPDVFLERSLPVEVESGHILIAFFVPYLVSSVFTVYAILMFNKENTSYVEVLRKVGD